MSKDVPYFSTQEALKALGISMSTFRKCVVDLGIRGHRFATNHAVWYAKSDIERIKAYRREPWRLEELKQRPDEQSTQVKSAFIGPIDKQKL